MEKEKPEPRSSRKWHWDWDKSASRGRVLGLLTTVGNEFPELRLCQLIVNVTTKGDPFYVTDDELSDALIRYRDTHDSTESPR